jgi:hypothetical protein
MNLSANLSATLAIDGDPFLARLGLDNLGDFVPGVFKTYDPAQIAEARADLILNEPGAVAVCRFRVANL